MPGTPSSNNKGMKLTSFHLMVSSFAALAGVGIAAFQMLSPSGVMQPPINVTVAVDPSKPAGTEANMVVGKSGGDEAIEAVNAAAKGDGIAERGGFLDLRAGNAKFLAALNDGSEKKYVFADLFDGRPETAVVLSAPDKEVNILVDFGTQTAVPISGISYSPPPPQDGAAPATVFDVMVLPEGEIGGAGGQVLNFTLQTNPGQQSFALPVKSAGKGLWLRIAGGQMDERIVIGDFKIQK
jgi:hypothetical protein